ncbi:MAG TPA: endonuclease [Rhodothermales bacterium]|nr:endonuclease [Rhodothermales bacterium]
MKKLVFIKLSLLLFPLVVLAQTNDLFISEYVEGTSNNKAIEIYNGTGVTIDLSAYVVETYATSASYSLQLTGTLANNATIVIANPGASFVNQPYVTFTSDITFYNGDDAIVLKKNGFVIDSFGQKGVDPGVNWSSNGVATSEQTLRRKATICTGDANPDDAFDPSLEWESYPQNTFDGLGSHTVSGCSGSGNPTCPVPSNVQVSNVTASSGLLSWGPVAEATNGYVLGFKANSTPTYTQQTTTSTQFTWSSLSSGTLYQYQLQSDCGNGNRSAVVSGSFQTITLGTKAVIRLRDPYGLYLADQKMSHIFKEADGQITIPIEVISAGTLPFTLSLTVNAGNATNGQDYVLGSVAVPAGTAGTLQFPISLSQDGDDAEGVEYANLSLNATEATIQTPNNFTLWIKDRAIPKVTLFAGQYGETLKLSVRDAFTCLNDGISYSAARPLIYRYVEPVNQQICGFYDNYCINVPFGSDGNAAATGNGMNMEHIWPQSMGAGSDPMQSDMHHLRPTLSSVNSARSNYPFAELPDVVSSWYQGTSSQSAVPANPDMWSQRYNSEWEPRKAVRGDVSRAAFYFFTMYSAASTSFFANSQDAIIKWTDMDPVDEVEFDRSLRVAAFQCYQPNPIILDPSVMGRVLNLATTKEEDTVPDGVFELTETFPNPASRWIQVAYRLHQPARVQFELFDMLGRKVQETDIAFQSSGSFQQTVDTSTLSSGRYVLRAISGPQAIIRLVTVIN